MTTQTQQAILSAARAQIGKKYNEVDCSNFVHQSYAVAGLHYPYTNTARFHSLTSSGQDFFESVEEKDRQAGDVVLYPGHMGIWDPEGCKVLKAGNAANPQCSKLGGNAPVLSSRSGGNRGPDFGVSGWFGTTKGWYRWKGVHKAPSTGAQSI